jgi:D-alanine-D-alanine ligase
MVGNPPQILPIIEPDHASLPAGYERIDSIDVKWILEEEVGPSYLQCPAPIDATLQEKIHDLCRRAWDVVGIYDYCRMDVRCDSEGNPYILEINSPA